MQRSVIAPNLAGRWIVDTALTLRLGGHALAGAAQGSDDRVAGTIEFVFDATVVGQIPPDITARLKAFSMKTSGQLSFGTTKFPYVMVVDTLGNSNVVYFKARGGNPFGNAESFILSLVPGKEPSGDLLFIGGDFSHEPFSAFRRPGLAPTGN